MARSRSRGRPSRSYDRSTADDEKPYAHFFILFLLYYPLLILQPPFHAKSIQRSLRWVNIRSLVNSHSISFRILFSFRFYVFFRRKRDISSSRERSRERERRRRKMQAEYGSFIISLISLSAYFIFFSLQVAFEELEVSKSWLIAKGKNLFVCFGMDFNGLQRQDSRYEFLIVLLNGCWMKIIQQL